MKNKTGSIILHVSHYCKFSTKFLFQIVHMGLQKIESCQQYIIRVEQNYQENITKANTQSVKSKPIN